MNLRSFVTHSEVTLRKLEPTVSTVKIPYENSLGTSGLKESDSLNKVISNTWII